MKHLLSALSALALAGLCPAVQAASTTYHIVQTYNQVVYDSTNPSWDTVFTGTFSYDDVTHQVSALQGLLSQAMDGNTTWVPLTHQLSAVSLPGLGGVAISVFAQDSTDVFAGGGHATGGKLTYGNENAYITAFINLADPTAGLTDAQARTLAYADCTAGGLMPRSKPVAQRTVCMTGWIDDSKANLAGGTMQGTYPVTQLITAVPEPSSAVLALSALALTGGLHVRRTRLRAPTRARG